MQCWFNFVNLILACTSTSTVIQENQFGLQFNASHSHTTSATIRDLVRKTFFSTFRRKMPLVLCVWKLAFILGIRQIKPLFPDIFLANKWNFNSPYMHMHLYIFILLLALRTTLEQLLKDAQPLALSLLIERASYMILTTEYIYIYLPLPWL